MSDMFCERCKKQFRNKYICCWGSNRYYCSKKCLVDAMMDYGQFNIHCRECGKHLQPHEEYIIRNSTIYCPECAVSMFANKVKREEVVE